MGLAKHADAAATCLGISGPKTETESSILAAHYLDLMHNKFKQQTDSIIIVTDIKKPYHASTLISFYS
jgi:hypothetical protein